MKVCANCFKDNTVKGYVELIAIDEGLCPCCGTEGKIVDVSALFDIFYGLYQYYEFNGYGDSRLFQETIQQDWDIFTPMGRDLQRDIVDSIFSGSGINIGEPQNWKLKTHPEVDSEWDRFAEDIKHTNRFFCPKPYDDIGLNILYELLKVKKYPDSSFFRARQNAYNKRYNSKSMGSPPKLSANGGRANPKGIPYLYLTDDKDTAIAEIRPVKGQNVTVGYFKLQTEISIVEFRKVTPFEVLLYSESILQYSKVNKIIELIMRKLSEPVNPIIADFEYLTTQYICEEIKHLGYDGVSFPSAMGTGTNYAIFNSDGKFKCTTTKQNSISDVKYTIR